jgi:hypothetical protein
VKKTNPFFNNFKKIKMKTKQLLMALCLMILASCSNYSEGERTGVITKFSKKGAVYKTWEGELLQGGFKKGNEGTEANVFQFSIDADKERGENIQSLVDALQAALNSGLPVRLTYSQEIFTNCSGSRGETSYFITAVKIDHNEKHN